MKIFFFCCTRQTEPNNTGYEHNIISIAEGLKQMGIQPLGNINYWRNSLSEDDYLIRKQDYSNLDDYDVVVYSSSLFDFNISEILPKDLQKRNRKYKLIFIDGSDGLITPGFDKQIEEVDLVLKSHYCSLYKYPAKFIPWQFGLTNRIIQSVKPLPFEIRENITLSNFRVNHQLRTLAEKKVMSCVYEFYPKNSTTEPMVVDSLDGLELLFWQQTGRRHYTEYYLRLGKSKITNAIGGYAQKWLTEKNILFFKILRKIDNRLNLFPYDRIYQFDSWRFWESLASGCCTIHMDFESYGMRLPVMPKNGVHYLGLNLKKPEKIKVILSNEEQIKSIGANGREWVLENYSPLAVAKRFINHLDQIVLL